jgi:hypothetical protein
LVQKRGKKRKWRGEIGERNKILKKEEREGGI